MPEQNRVAILKRFTVGLIAVWVLAGIAACGFSGQQPNIGLSGIDIATTVESCQSLLSRDDSHSPGSLTSGNIDILSWNIAKGSKRYWERDLSQAALGKDFVILQEVIPDDGIEQYLGDLRLSAFSQGFTTRSRRTGVATYSRHSPVSECRLSVAEPWLKSPKATSISEYSIDGRRETLLVINAHVVNISFGLVRFREQMTQISDVLSVHKGPVILAGDFNTWRKKRLDVVNEIAGSFAMTQVDIDKDHRKTFNGYALDHVLVRGLSIIESETQNLESSDHNPIAVELVL